MSYGIRLVCYDVDGARRDPARGMLIERYARAGEAGRLLVDFSELAPRSDLFDMPVEIAVEYLDGDEWVEPEDGRYYISRNAHERVEDPTNTHDLTLIGYVQRLNGPKVRSAPANETNSDGKRQFLSRTPGQIIGALITEAKARGSIPALEVGFTATHDSNGDPWPQIYNRAYELSHSILGILQNLYDGGAVDYWTDGRTLHMVPAGTRGRDLTTGPDPVYLRDRYVKASPENDDWGALADTVILIGDNGHTWEKTNPQAYKPFGRQETVIIAGGVSDEGTATLMMDRALAAGAEVAREITREWDWANGTRWMPDRDIRIGDWVLADTAAGKQRVRVADLMVRQGPDGIEAFVTLGTIADDALTRMAKRQVGIEGGAGVGSLGRPTAPPPPQGELQYPAAPAGLQVTATAWPIPGGYGGVVGASWDAVTQDQAGFAITPDQYTVRARRQGSIAWIDPLFRTDGDLVGQAERGDMRPGETWEVQVAGMEGDRTGAWSTTWTGTVQEDRQAPGIPSRLAGHSTPAQVALEWDGLDSDGQEMDLDLRHIVVAADGVAATWTLGLTSRQLRIDAGPGQPLQVGETYTFRAKAVDYAGNESGWSVPVFVAVMAETPWPAAPTSVLAEPSTFTADDGSYRGLVAVSWAPVTADVDGNPATIQAYVVRARRTQGAYPVDWFDLGETPDGNTTSGSWSSALMVPGDVWEIQVGARSSYGHTGGFAPVPGVAVTIPPDSEAPPAPSVPGVSADHGVLTVVTDGLSVSGGGMPLDLDHYLVRVTGLSQTWVMDKTTRTRSIVAGPVLQIGTAYEVRLSAVDRAGNESPLSQPAGPVTLASVLDGTDWAAQMAKITSWGDNLYPDSLFLDEARNTIREQAGAGFIIANGVISPAASTAQQIWLTPSGEVAGPNRSRAEFVKGRSYVVSATVDASQFAAAQVGVVAWNPVDLGMVWVGPTKVTIVAGGQLQLSRVWVCDDPAKQLGIWVEGAPYVRGITVQERVRTTLIEDGSITADKTYFDQSYVNKLTAALAEFDGVTTGWLKARDIATDALDFKSAKGMTLTSSIFTTTGVANRGIWLNGSDNTLKMFDPSGLETFRLDGNTGRPFVSGDYQTTGAFPRVEMRRDIAAGFGVIQWVAGPGWARNAQMRTNYARWGNDTPGGLYMMGGDPDGLTMHAEVALRSGYDAVYNPNRYWPEFDALLGIGEQIHGRIRIRDVGQNRTSIYQWANFIELTTKTGQGLLLNVPGSPGDVRLASPTAGVLLQTGNGWITMQGIGPSTGGEDLRLEGGWRVVYAASEKRYKLERETVPVIPAVLQLKPTTWVDRGRREADPAYTKRTLGLVYEQVHDVVAAASPEDQRHMDALMSEFDRGGGDVTHTINYSSGWVLLIPIIRALWEAVMTDTETTPRRAA